jgi:cobalamin biosynthesis protein CobD/CbiB
MSGSGIIISSIAFLLSVTVNGTTWYAATDGSDINPGTEQYNFQTIGKAVSLVQAGEIIYVRGGTYNLSTTIVIAKSGSSNSVISLLAYPEEKPVLDFSS